MATPWFALLLVVAAGVAEEVGGDVAATWVPEEAETDADAIDEEVVDPDMDEDDAEVLLDELVLVVEVEVYEVYVAEGSIVVTIVPGDKLKT
jgi:hypothetical protein